MPPSAAPAPPAPSPVTPPAPDRPARRRSAQLRSEAAAFLREHPPPATSAASAAPVSPPASPRARPEALQALQRVHSTAMGTLPRSAEHDRQRLSRFHAQAVSFLRRAYADDTDTLVPDEQPASPLSDASGREALQRFHASALQIARTGTLRGDATAVRIARDKARLEAHYQDAMSFLERGEGGLVVETELEGAAVERLQLQRYAREAMSFLDKAFSGDTSVLVEDELLGEEDELRREAEERRVEEARQIAEDRAALERYEEEFADFLSKAYDGDSAVIVDDADSSTSGNERGLFARRVAASTTSAESGFSGSGTHDDEFSDEAYTDDEFQVAESSRLDVLHRELPSPTVDTPSPAADCSWDDGNDNVRRRMVRYEREAADYLDGANVSEEEEEAEHHDHIQPQQQQQPQPKQAERTDREHLTPQPPHDIEPYYSREQDAAREQFINAAFEDDDGFGADREIDDEEPSTPKDTYDDDSAPDSLPNDFEVQHSPSPDHSTIRNASTATDSQDLLVDLMLEDNSGRSREWSEVPLEKSFYRQVPRGSTIKLRPRHSTHLSSPGYSLSVTGGSPDPATLEELQRVERERDALMATLEEIVNERSMLAAQVSEMKAMIQGAGGASPEQKSDIDQAEDIDLAAELRDAHATMARLTEEMEATLAVLDNRYQETLRRAHRAEERCIRLETDSAQLQQEFTKQDKKLAQALADERRAVAAVSRAEKEVDSLRKKSEIDIGKIDDSYRVESERSTRKIRELTNEVAALQEQLKASSASSSSRRGSSPTRRLELEVEVLRRRVREGERRLIEERALSKKKLEADVRSIQGEKDREIRGLSARIERLGLEAKDVDKLNTDFRRSASENGLVAQLEEMGKKVAGLQGELREAKRGQVTAEAEANHMRARYEESLKERIARMGESGELVELQGALRGLKEGAAQREKSLELQLAEFRRRAEQAEIAASNAEKNAQEAVDAAKLTQDRSRLAVDSERKARMAAEAEAQTVAMESKAWEKFAQQQMESKPKSDERTTDPLVKSSSRRGLRKSPSKNNSKDSSKKKRDNSKAASGSGDEPKKKSHRPRLFG